MLLVRGGTRASPGSDVGDVGDGGDTHGTVRTLTACISASLTCIFPGSLSAFNLHVLLMASPHKRYEYLLPWFIRVLVLGLVVLGLVCRFRGIRSIFILFSIFMGLFRMFHFRCLLIFVSNISLTFQCLLYFQASLFLQS